jgi:uncharacterized protein (TIGR02246 family)
MEEEYRTENWSLVLLLNWVNAVQAHKTEDVISLYSEDSVLLGTMDSEVPRVGKERVGNYFDSFLKKKPEKIVFDKDMNIQYLKDNMVLVSGYYTFYVKGDSSIKAKYTFCLEKIDDSTVKIVLHNSGLTPSLEGNDE